MKTLSISIIAVLALLSLMTTNVFAQNQTNAIPPNAIRTSDGGWITPLQTHTENGGNLTIHYETGTSVAGSYLPPGPPPMFDSIQNQTIPSPLEQFKTGTQANDVKCNGILQLVFKAEDDSPACVKSEDVAKLVERGWATQAIPSGLIGQVVPQNNSDALEFLLSINSTVIKPNQTLGINITLDNTSPNMLVKDQQNTWAVKGLNMGPCELDPVGITIYEGNYSLETAAGARPLQLHQNGTYMCQMLVGVDRYFFEPSGDKAISETQNGNSTGEMKYGTSFDGFYTKSGFEQPPAGTYTVVGGDEWGHATIQHFTVVNSTSLNIADQTSQVIPSCVSNIQDQYAIAGPPGYPMCPLFNFQSSGQIVNSTGFYGIYNYTKFADTQNFVLEPGHNGTITYKISMDSISNFGDAPPLNEINMTNGVSFMHDAGMNNHPGVYVSVYPQSEVMQKNSTILVTITFAASKDASRGTYWVHLPPGICTGGQDIILTVTDCSGKK